MNSILNYTLEQLKDELKSDGKPGFLADQIFNWIYKNYEFNPELWTNVSKVNKLYLQDKFSFKLPKVVWNGLSKDGTRKFLLGLKDSQTVEAVAIPAKDRLTLCVSSQVGCAIGCTFCHTGTQGLTRNLETSEIVGQLMSTTIWMRERVNPEIKYTNIVFMGMGEPLHNFVNSKNSITIFLEDKGLGLGQRRVTLSTSGLVPQIKKLDDFPPVNIAISLHAAHNDIRTELMPINKRFDLERLFEAIRSIPLKAHRRITYEYILIDGLNNEQKDIDELCRLLNKKESKVNIIPFNEYPGSDFKRPSESNIQWFNQQLNNRGLISTVRTTKGTDILAACGQLKTFVESKKVNTWTLDKGKMSYSSQVHASGAGPEVLLSDAGSRLSSEAGPRP